MFPHPNSEFVQCVGRRKLHLHAGDYCDVDVSSNPSSQTCFVSLLSQNPKAFLESYEEMLRYALKQETWPTTQQELEGRGVGKDIVFTELQRS